MQLVFSSSLIFFWPNIIMNVVYTNNNIYNQLRVRIPLHKIKSRGMCKLKFKQFIKSHVGHNGSSTGIHLEHKRYFKTNNQIAAYALHIRNNKCRQNRTTTEIVQRRKQNKLLVTILHTDFRTTKHTNQ